MRVHRVLGLPMTLPLEIKTEDELSEVLTQPPPTLVQFIRTVTSPLIVLGAGGKMGPTLAVLAKRAAVQAGHNLEVIAVSRFTDAQSRTWLEERGVKTQKADLLSREDVSQLPDAQNLIYLVGLKFGTAQFPAATWAMNTIPVANVALRYPGSRIVGLSSGNVYPFSEVNGVGSQEEDPLTPLGEYPNAVVARERLFEFYSQQKGISVALIRLFYAVELRYGVLADIAGMILRGEPINLSNGHFNCIWMGDANEMIIRSLSLVSSPPSRFNLCQPEIYSVRAVASELGEHMSMAPLFSESETGTALIGDPSRICQALGRPGTRFAQVLKWTADWVRKGGRTLGKPTHFEVRDGVY